MTRLDAAVAELIEAIRETVREEAAAAPRTPDRLLSIPEAMAALSISRPTIYGEIGSGRLATLKIARRRMVSSSAIGDYIADRQAAR